MYDDQEQIQYLFDQLDPYENSSSKSSSYSSVCDPEIFTRILQKFSDPQILVMITRV